MKTEFQSMGGSTQLDRATPDLYHRYEELSNRHTLYSVTITYKTSYAITLTEIRTLKFKGDGRIRQDKEYVQKVRLGSMPREDQIIFAGAEIRKIFKGLEGTLFPEFQKNGTIHWHGIMYHPLCNGKVVEDAILKQLRKFGKCQDCSEINSLRNWVNYMSKERRDPLEISIDTSKA